MTGKERAELRKMANGIDAILQVGKGGINENLIKQTDDALEARELIKLSVLETAPLDAKEAAETIAAATGADVVSVVGRRFVIYRESVENKKIFL